MFLFGGLLCVLGVFVTAWGGIGLLFDVGSAVQSKAEGEAVNPLAKRGMKGSLKILLVGVVILFAGAGIMALFD